MIATDGVFSMDGDIAPLAAICDLAEKYDALVMVDDSHATGFIGKTGRGTPEHCGVAGRVDIVTSTLGKALGGASGGFTSRGRRSSTCCGSAAGRTCSRTRSRRSSRARRCGPRPARVQTTELRDRLEENTQRFRERMTAAGFAIRPGVHPIVPIMLGPTTRRSRRSFARALLDEGIYVIGFFFPVVPARPGAHPRAALGRAHAASTSTVRSPRSRRSAASWAF